MLSRDRYQVFKQQRGDAAPVHVVGHRERDFRVRRSAGGLVRRNSDQPAAEQGQEGKMPVVCGPAYPGRLALGRLGAQAKKAEISIIWG